MHSCLTPTCRFIALSFDKNSYNRKVNIFALKLLELEKKRTKKFIVEEKGNRALRHIARICLLIE